MSKKTHLTEENVDFFILTILFQEINDIYTILRIEPFMERHVTVAKVLLLNPSVIDLVIDKYHTLLKILHPTVNLSKDIDLAGKREIVNNMLVNWMTCAFTEIDGSIEPMVIGKRLLAAGKTVNVNNTIVYHKTKGFK